jgi:hypothetical protein
VKHLTVGLTIRFVVYAILVLVVSHPSGYLPLYLCFIIYLSILELNFCVFILNMLVCEHGGCSTVLNRTLPKVRDSNLLYNMVP